MAEWHLVTSEYPPQPGGVSDYTSILAAELAAVGDTVHVWCPPARGEVMRTPGVVVHRELGKITPAALRRVSRLLNAFAAPRRLFVQWVPHGYGFQSMNLFFCSWLWERAVVHRDWLDIMVHEPYLAFGHGSWKQNVAAAVHRLMTTILLNAARHVWMSVPAWEGCWRPYALGRHVPFTWLPVPSNIPVVEDPAGVAAVRARYAPGGEFVVGHFGTYGPHIARLLRACLPPLLLDRPNRVALLLGAGGEGFRGELLREHPTLAGRLHATDSLTAADVSRHLSACDVLVQPYQDGVTSRRTSLMVGLVHGLPIVTTSGPLTGPVWEKSRAVHMVPVGDAAALVRATEALLGDAAERQRLAAAARALYRDCFDVKHTVAALRATTGEAAPRRRQQPCVLP